MAYDSIIVVEVHDMKIVGFNGSPHNGGNTAWVVEQILEGAKREGAETVSFSACATEIKPCQGCFGCKSASGTCVIKDDMQEVYAELKNADALVFASPIYMGQMSGQAKVFMDRLFPTNSPRFSPYYKEQGQKVKLLLVFTQGNLDRLKFQTYVDYTKQMFEVLEYAAEDVFVVAGTRSEKAKDMAGLDKSLLDVGAGLLR
jgi:multimeric flavodoxin WrbA